MNFTNTIRLTLFYTLQYKSLPWMQRKGYLMAEHSGLNGTIELP